MRLAETFELQQHIGSEISTLARLMTLTPRGGDPIYFTEHDEDIEYLGNTYLSASGFECSAIQNVVGGGNSNLEVSIFLQTDEDRQRIIGGYYSGALISINVVNYEDLSMGHMPMTVGLVTEVTLPYRQKAVLVFQGRASASNKYLTESYTPTCRAIFCDARCGLNVNDFRDAFTVTTADGTKGFTTADGDLTTGFYNLGVVRWENGDNAGQATEIRTSDAGTIVLMIRTRFPIQVGDTGILERGCAKTLEACRAYGNVLNFRGEPFMPGQDYTKSNGTATPPPEAAEPPVTPPTGGGHYAI